MSFPSPSLPVPALTPWQFSYGGLAFGGVTLGATYQLKEAPEGLDTPDYVTGDVQRALDQGEYAGLDLSPGRNIVLQQIIGATTAQGLDAARQAFAGVLSPAGSTEQPLYVQLASGPYACMARPRKHKFSAGVSDVFAYATVATTMWHATDPRWYAMPSQAAAVGLPELVGGLTFPATFPVTFLGGSVGNIVTINNTGKMEMRPVVVFTGPLQGPKVANLSLPGNPSLQFETTLNAGDTLTVDLDWQSVVLRTVGTVQGSSRRSSEKAGSTWFNCPKGVNTLAFASQDKVKTGGSMTVEWAPAYMGL